jgi:hypothetical protein
MVVFASLVVGFCSGFLSLFGVVLCELGKKGKPTGRPSGRALSAGFPSALRPKDEAPAAVLRERRVSKA